MANRLAQESSPYLLQHKDNPVEWYPWGPDALERARSQDRPILLSIGYSSCHWCHVMERESFEDPETAAFMNEHFVPVKVDREERPDVDAIYMEAVQGMTGQGGWPLTAFCDPAGAPFYGGTYFPPEARHGLPSFRMVMEAVAESWGSQRERIRESAARIREQLGAVGRMEPTPEDVGPETLDGAVRQLRMSADPVNGGFGGAPKFPPASALEFLLARGETDLVERALDGMAQGGIHDQLGGGFARYSVDAGWLVPHFEKMLYDNALLARAYLHGWQATGPRALAARSARTRWTGPCARCAAPRAGSSRPSTPTPRARRDVSTSGRGASCCAALEAGGLGGEAEAILRALGRDRGRELRGAEHPPPPRRARRGGARGLGARPRAAVRAALGPGPPRPRRQARPLLERAHGRRPRRRRRRPGPPRLPRGRRALRRVHARDRCATATDACCAPGRRARDA